MLLFHVKYNVVSDKKETLQHLIYTSTVCVLDKPSFFVSENE